MKPLYQSTGSTLNQDGFPLKLDPTGATLLYGTYLGGSGTDGAAAVIVDASGTATVVGQTASNDFVGLTGSVDGDSDAFILQVSADGSTITSGRFIGGSGADQALAVSPR